MIIKKKKPIVENTQTPPEPVKKEAEDIFDGINFDEIDFLQRKEKRKGDRRRGYRRIDDRAVVSRAQEEANSIREQAVKEGYKQGLDDAVKDVALLGEAIQEFYGFKSKVYEEISKDIVDIAVEIAEKVIKKEIAQDKTILLKTINDLLHQISKDETKIRIRVNPKDVHTAKENLPEILSNSQLDAKIMIVTDENVDESSVIIETGNGIIDASIKTQLEIIKEAFKLI